MKVVAASLFLGPVSLLSPQMAFRQKDERKWFLPRFQAIQ